MANDTVATTKPVTPTYATEFGAVAPPSELAPIHQLVGVTVAIILAGGRGTRLGPLTDWRAKPAVPFGGKFRIIDFALSNCVNSGIRRIGVCTQYKAQSLIRHMQQGWSFLDGRLNEFIELLPAQQRLQPAWYEGTADAVFQNLDILRRYDPKYVLVLAGDHVYKMNYGKMIRDHVLHDADMTIGCIEVSLEHARSFGVMTIDESSRIIAFAEKPRDPTPLPGRTDVALASMGIYVVSAPFLYDTLARDAQLPGSTRDFGKDLIPYAINHDYRIFAHPFGASCVNVTGAGPYWRDVGTIDAYWEANMELAKVTPDLDLYDAQWPIWTHQEQLPPAKFVFDDDGRRGTALDSLVAGGCIISGSTVRRSLLFSNVHVHSYCTMEDTVVLPNVDIARRVVLKRCVIDKDCRLPEGLQVGVDPESDRRRFHVTDSGITLVTPEMLGYKVHYSR